MKTWSGCITISVSFSAINEKQAEERVEHLAELCLKGLAEKGPKWSSDPSYEAEVEEES